MTEEEFEIFRRVLEQTSGLTLSRDKTYLLESRLEPVARRHGLSGLSELAQALKRGGGRFADEVAEAMTTNESSFFRDGRPFEQLRDQVLPDLLSRRPNKRLHIWSAGCAKGQEPLSIAMTVLEARAVLGDPGVEIVATDLSREMIEQARAGRFTTFEVRRGVPDRLLSRYFHREHGGIWRVDPSLKRLIDFRVHNLMDGMFGGPYDVIFCRNVLLYFDVQRKRRVLEHIARVLQPDGALVLGGAETVMGLTDALTPIPGLRGTYTKAGPAAASAG